MSKNTKNILSIMVIAFFAWFIGALSVQAAGTCTYRQKADLNAVAGKVKTSYELVEKKEPAKAIDPDSGEVVSYERITYEFKISIYNITDDIYLSYSYATADVTSRQEMVPSTMVVNGVYSFTDKNLGTIATYTFKIHSNLDECRGMVIKTYTFKKPKSNMFSSLGACKGNEALPMCRPFITEEIKNITEANLADVIERYLASPTVPPKPPGGDETWLDFLSDNLVYIIIGVVIVAGAAGGTIYFVKKRSAL